MTRNERKALQAQDHQIDTRGAALGAGKIRRYRELLIKHVSEAATMSRWRPLSAHPPV